MDDVLLQAIGSLKSGAAVKDLAQKYNMSLDKAKKLSQLANMQKQIEILEPSLQEKFMSLGFKALVLNPLFKENDIEGIKEILESVDIDIKRETLRTLPDALKLKKERLEQAKLKARYMIENLESVEKITKNKIQELEDNKKKLDESLEFLSDVTDETAKKFLMEHLGVAKGNLVLYKRLDISWQRNLKQKKVISYNINTFTWDILNLDELKRQVEKRVKNKNNMYYDYTKATGPYADSYPVNPVYKNAQGLSFSILDAVNENEKELKELKRKKREINKELKELKRINVQTYIGAAELSNHLSEHEILTHRKLQNSGMRYLYNMEQVSITELAEDSYRFDVIGYDKAGCLTIIEAKASIEDFRADDKFNRYISYCNKMYFIFQEDLFQVYKREILEKIKRYNIGVLVETKDNAAVMEDSGIWSMDEGEKITLTFKLNRLLSRKFIYGQ